MNKLSIPDFNLENKISNYKCINTFFLKLFAIIIMTIDHIGAIIGTERFEDSNYITISNLIPYDTYVLLRSIGRLAFPIFCYLIAEGFFYTRNVYKYALRLLIFAFVSQIPFSLGIHKLFINYKELNVFFTLTLGLISIIIVDKCITLYKKNKDTETKYLFILLSVICTLIITLFANFLTSDYEWYGVLLVLSFYLLKDKYICQLLIIGYITYLFCNKNIHDIQMLSLYALIPIWLHNHKKGPGLKYFFYLYYPLHQIVLYFIYLYMN